MTEEQKRLAETWDSLGLGWTSLKWHPGMSLWQKLKDVLLGIVAVGRLRLHGFRHIVALGSVAGSFAYLSAILLRMRLFLYQYEPHSEVSAAAGAWSERSIQYRLARFFERMSAQYAHVIASGTRFMGERLHDEWRVRAKFFRIPTVVNEDKFKFDPDIALEMREELGLAPDQPVIFYTGKFGGLYYSTEIAQAFAALLEYEPRLHMLIVTPNEDAYVHGLFDDAYIDRSHYSICHSSYDDIERYYFVGDLGLITIPPGPGQEFRSSIKVGEYLCAGMPFLTPAGVSEDYVHATEQDVGVVVKDYSDPEIRKAWPEVSRFLSMDCEDRRRHCRKFGIEYRGFVSLNPVFKSAIKALIEE
ncbi:glycosyltransferase family protein [Ovoidimarina sediminis]|uniref:hypothetical protein n=1 Tax=Ovoidimarina sediminis TaxID=3079856 RepID=UPI002913E5BC|nr:hypothetical protein [Rhodophyticola sp. MJ-SS7]MDU8946146.1 hypothetical protein [Rhodophyticola sp. MJ-SS7]